MAELVPLLTRHLRNVNHAIRTALLWAGYYPTLEPLCLDSSLWGFNPELRADQLVYGIEVQRDTFVDVAITCPTPPTFLAKTQFCCRNAARMKFQEKLRKYAAMVRTQPGGTGFQLQFVPLG